MPRADPATHPLEGVATDPLDASARAWLAASGVRRVVVGHKPSGDSPSILRRGGGAARDGGGRGEGAARPTGTDCDAAEADDDAAAFELISADTSYSDVGADDNRGVAVSAVRLVYHRLRGGDDGATAAHDGGAWRSRARVAGVLSDGREYDFALPWLQPAAARGAVDRALEQPAAADDGDALVGRQTVGGWWVKAVMWRDDDDNEDGGDGRRPGQQKEYRLSRGVGRAVEYRTVGELELRGEMPPATAAVT